MKMGVQLSVCVPSFKSCVYTRSFGNSTFFFLQLRVMFYLVIKTKDLSQEHSLRAGKIQGKDIEDMEEFLQQRPDSQT